MSALHVTMLGHEARSLAGAWQSKVIAAIGDARVKILRMDGSAYPEEHHDTPEALLVLEGELRLVIGGHERPVRAGEIAVVPEGVAHSVGAGSHGTLVIVDVADGSPSARAAAAAAIPAPAARCP
jgi:mannose-6-phosphate isomerase-like protein (cupin superfamily)